MEEDDLDLGEIDFQLDPKASAYPLEADDFNNNSSEHERIHQDDGEHSDEDFNREIGAPTTCKIDDDEFGSSDHESVEHE
jgi:hypothetical protein